MVSQVEALKHEHNHGIPHAQHEVKTGWVVALTCAMMFGELAVGYFTNSLALTADGWHMATHAGALGMAWLAYRFARTRAHDASFSFGTGKVHALAGYTSAIILAIVALWMMFESVIRLLNPLPIAFSEALPVAVLGLLVNLVSVKLLHVDQHGHDDHHHDDHHHDDHGHGHDHNLRAAYMHVLADAFTSVLAIFALLGGRYLGWLFLDPLMGIVGGTVILRWSLSLCTGAAKQLLDMVPSLERLARIRERLENLPGTEVVDLHLWELGPGARACIASVVSTDARSPLMYSEALRRHEGLQHVTVEVHRTTE
jgi:cation diffusion facilitator family transporter